MDPYVLNTIVLEYLHVQKSVKQLAFDNQIAPSTLRRHLHARGISMRNKAEQRRSDLVFGRYDHSEALKRAWRHGNFDTEHYRASRSKSWVGEDHRGPNNAFHGRTHTVATRSALAFHARHRVIRGTGEYGPDWTAELRESVYRRDKYLCRACGRSGAMLQAHHLKGDRSDNANANLLTLCAACHLAFHGRREMAQEIEAAGNELARMAGSTPEAARDKGGDAAHVA